MWKVFLLFICVAGSVVIVSCDDETISTEETIPTGETNPTGDINPTGATKPTGASEPMVVTTGTNKRCGCSPTCGENEEYYNCSGGCIPRRCSEIGFPLNCDKKCTPGCVCKGSYVRADTGNCVPIPDCPSCGGDKNAQQGCGSNCGRTCSDYKKPPTRCPIGCIFNGCNCRKGFVYDNNVQACVKPEDCTPICQANEEYSSCTNGGCDARNCSQVGKPVPCVKLDPRFCIKGCVCVKGYLRASNDCVPEDQCTFAKPGYNCGLNEVSSNCTNGGCDARNCSQVGKPVPCVKLDPKSCILGCVCKPGYLRATNGTCVPQNQCNNGCGDDPNAHSGCGVNCGRTCSTYKTKDVACILICNLNGCDCNDGYVFDPNVNKCVLPEKCTPTCGQNEVYSTCTNGGCGYRNCSQLGQPQLCIDRTPESCTKGCICASGYLRANNGTCVPQDKCPASVAKPGYNCGLNEVSSNCTNGGCDARNCSQVGKPVPCVKLDPKSCILGCVCKPGYLRATNGTCVPQNQCNNGCGDDPNAHSGCGVNCGRTCSTYKTKDVACILICNLNGCDCNDGYVFDPNVNKCVLPEKCTPTCGQNEVYSTCTNGGCGHRNCSQLGQPQLCIDRTPESCTKGCICASGYLRANNGTCVPQDKCQASVTCGTNEEYDVCPAPCPPRRCDVDDSLIRCVAPPQPGDPQCKPGCRCRDNYARNATGTCVLREQCEQRLICDQPNEIYDSCPAPCPGQSCDVDPALVLCAPSPQYGDAACQPACRCIDGYVRNSTNKCVARDQCPSADDQCPGQNEFFDTCISGCSNQTCETIGKIFNCPLQPAVCRTGCRCNPGFYRNASNVCVSESQCPAPRCPSGEVYSRCPTVKCEGDYCPKTRNSPLTCPVGIVCDQPRCVCGLLDRRDRKTGKCIRSSDCPPFKCDGPNEEYQSCPSTCPGEKCTDYINGSKCPPFRIGIVVACQPQCRCTKGYYRNSDGICILASQCGPKNATTPATPVILHTTPTPKLQTTDSGDHNGDDKNGRDSLEAGITEFNGKFLYDRMKSSQGENIITSPYSVLTPLAQLALYANGDSWKQLTSILNLSSKQNIRNTFPALATSFDGQTSVNFSTAAKIYSYQEYPLSDSFKKDSVDVVNAEAQELDFSKNTNAADTINTWVESKTNNRIKDLISPSDISALTRLVLVNAIYFKGNWQYPFDKKNTKDADFYLSDGTVKKSNLMYQESRFNYGEIPELNCTTLEMFYNGRNFSMLIVLPNVNDGVLRTAKNLQDAGNFKKVLGSMSSNKVKVYVPAFEINTTTDLTTILKQEGVTKIFDAADSGLSGILKTQENTYVSKAIQKAFIKVDEIGSEAAASNGLVVGTTAAIEPPRDIVFRCDRSFLYYITFRRTVLFSGAFVNPN